MRPTDVPPQKSLLEKADDRCRGKRPGAGQPGFASILAAQCYRTRLADCGTGRAHLTARVHTVASGVLLRTEIAFARPLQSSGSTGLKTSDTLYHLRWLVPGANSIQASTYSYKQAVAVVGGQFTIEFLGKPA